MSAEVSLALGDRGLRSYLIAFAITQLVEVPIYALALGRAPTRARRSPLRRALIGFGASAITHPVVWFVMPAVTLWIRAAVAGAGGPALGRVASTIAYGVLAEGVAVVVEATYLKAFGLRRALRWALAANAASVAVGTAWVWLLG